MSDPHLPKKTSLNLKSAVKQIYEKGEELIILGLTGRTGSGCSTAARILQSSQQEIKHSLFTGHEPKSNEQRKEKIIHSYFKETWKPFHLIQVRSIITLFLLDKIDDVVGHLKKYRLKARAILVFHGRLQQLIQLRDSNKNLTTFYTKTLPEKCEKIKRLLGNSTFVKLYQEIGTNLRLSGDPYSPKATEGKFFTIAEKVAEVATKIIQEHKKEPTWIVIDAIRNPLEAIFFQTRYSSFFLMAVSAPEEDRIARLLHQNFSKNDIEKIDKTENTARDPDNPAFFSVQDIPSCLQRADIYISNPNETDLVHQFQNLANQLIRFVSLIRRPGIVTPTALERCMQIAYTAKLNSGCISRQVGAVVTDQNFSVRAVGWNDAPHGQVPCNLRNRDDLVLGRDTEAYSAFERTDEKYLKFFRERTARYEKVPQERNKTFCFKSEYNKHTCKDNQVHTRSLHAEENAFLQVSKYGLAAVEGGFLFTTASPCELCAKKAYQLGITDIFYVDPYPGIAHHHILQGGTKNPHLKLFSGAIGRAFHQLYSPVVPYKDELEAYVTENQTNLEQETKPE